MTEVDAATAPVEEETTGAVAQSTYDLLRGRLESAAAELATRAGALNQRRLEAFGSSRLELIGTERVRTENNVVPRDVAAVDDQLIMAYNAQAGIRSEVRPEDVFSVHHLETFEGDDDTHKIVISPNPDGLAGSALDDDVFTRDFQELHTYFKEARVQQVYRSGEKLLAVFRTGTGLNDLRVLRWGIHADGGLEYLDDRGDRDHRFPARHDVEWVPTTRADHVANRYISVDERVFVDPLDGTFDIRLDDGSPDGELLLTDRLSHPDQALHDSQITYAKAGDLILVQVLPYDETATRYYVVNPLVRQALRLDALGAAFRQLPEGHGLIFPEGVYLRTGEVRRFDLDPSGMELLEVVHSPNGEDVLYVFHQADDGRSILLPYNVVRQEVTTPVWCHGYCLFEGGGMVVFREEPEPTRVHPIQIWTTPFCSDEWYADQPRRQTPLDRIGNAGLVAGIAESLALTRLVDDVEASAETYGDLLGSAGRLLDAHHWLGDEHVGDLAQSIRDIRLVAEQVIDEFERVQEVRRAAATALAEADDDLAEIVRDVELSPPRTTEGFIETLADLRRAVGHLHTVRERREIDVARVDELIGRGQEAHDRLAQQAAAHLAGDGAFADYTSRLTTLGQRTDRLGSSVEAAEVLAEVDAVAEAMDLVAGTVGDLVVDDPRVRTAVLEQVSAVLADLNGVRAGVQSRRDELIESETGAAFATELGLLGQTIATALARADSPEACDDALARLLLQLEQLETSAPRTEGQLDELTDRRDQVTESLSARRQQLVDERQQRADRLATAGVRTLQRVGDRAASLGSADDVNGFFAADPMVVRIRDLVEQLRAMGEPVRADELQGRLGSARDGALRGLRDRLELFDGDAVKLGRHRFSIDDRPRELTVVPHDDRLEIVLTGTDLRLGLERPELDEHRQLWSTPLPSETDAIYRAAYLAVDLLTRPPVPRNQLIAAATTADRAGTDDDPLLAMVRASADERLDEGYDRGVHDLDAAAILRALAAGIDQASTLVAEGHDRAEAQLAWAIRSDGDGRRRWIDRGMAAASVGIDGDTTDQLASELADELDLGPAASRYLLAELTTGEPLAFARTQEAAALANRLAGRADVAAALAGLEADPAGAEAVLYDVVEREAGADGAPHLTAETVAALVTPELDRRTLAVDLALDVDGLRGRHPTVDGGRLPGRIDELIGAVERHRAEVVPAHRRYTAARREAIDELRTTLRVDDLEPNVPEGFVRNRLIDRLYLPLIGDNLARQIGTVDAAANGVGSGARSGLLMLLSPPGYGKTTLVEYVADRLGMALVKISGPGLGHEVTSLDPGQAPSATAAREIERINLAFAIGTNVVLYLDDIQHTNPEFLQRFISLCDGQRRIEGVWNGRATTFDLRGKRFAVVMAGNPYTESGQRFRVPDMLANRADTYNLGDVLDGQDALFARSYLENALTANPVTAPLVGRDPADLDRFLRAAGGEPLSDADLGHGYSSAEVREIVAVLAHMQRVQSVVLSVNRQYIASAATDDDYRTEPPFLLQGSYRNMVRLAARIVPAMTPDEVETLIDEHYAAESQALTGAAEANLLKLAELRTSMTDEQRSRWDEIRHTFARRQRLGGDDRDPATRVVAAIEGIADALRADTA